MSWFTCPHSGTLAGVAAAQLVMGDHTEAVVLSTVRVGEGAPVAVRGAGGREALRAHQRTGVGQRPRRNIPGRHHRVGGTLHTRMHVSGNARS